MAKSPEHHFKALKAAMKSKDHAAAKTHSFNLGKALHKSVSAPAIEGGEPIDARADDQTAGSFGAPASVAPQPKRGLGNWMQGVSSPAPIAKKAVPGKPSVSSRFSQFKGSK